MMKGPELLRYCEDNWETTMGAWFPGERVVVRGQDLFKNFSTSSWMNYLLFVVTGKQNEKLSRLIESLWVISTSYPEPRLWPNRIATLAGSSRSTGVLGISAGIAASEATIYGLRPIKGAFHFLSDASEFSASEEELESFVLGYLKKHKTIYGFGRPFTPDDERIEPVLKIAKDMGFGDGKIVTLVFQIEKILYKNKKMKMNVAALNAAIISDAGLSLREYYHMASLAFSAGMFAPMIEAFDKPEGTFFPLSTERINYLGEGRRQW